MPFQKTAWCAASGVIEARSMISVSLGLLAALGWSTHDLMARRFAAGLGPFRLALGVLAAGALILLPIVVWRGQIWEADGRSLLVGFSMGIVYAAALGGLLVAFSLAPVSIVGPLTAAYPALVVVWGLLHGLVPTPLQWGAIVAVLAGVTIVSRSGHADDGADTVAPGKMPLVLFTSVVAAFGFAGAVILGQEATKGLGEYETTFVSRFPAMGIIFMALITGEKKRQAVTATSGLAMFAMAAADVTAVTAINAAAWFPNRELGAMAISSYAAISVVMAMVFLKERVTPGQWLGLALTVAGVGALGWQA
jgi:drug/metabolite transporter (DMT)-like permease